MDVPADPLRVAVIGAGGRLGAFAKGLLEREPGFELAGAFDRDDDWRSALERAPADVALEATRAGLGFEHGMALLELGIRPVIATSGVAPKENEALDARARELGLGGLVVPNFSIGSWLLLRAVAEAARHLRHVEIIELHHERKADAPSGTALETARLVERVRSTFPSSAPPPASEPPEPAPPARGELRSGVPIHSVRLPGLYAHQEVLLAQPGEVLSIRHDMHGPEAFGPGILRALRYAARATGVGRGIDLALA